MAGLGSLMTKDGRLAIMRRPGDRGLYLGHPETFMTGDRRHAMTNDPGTEGSIWDVRRRLCLELGALEYNNFGTKGAN